MAKQLPPFEIEYERRTVLHLPGNRVLVCAAGFVPAGSSHMAIQTTGTFPQLTAPKIKKGGKKKGR